MLSMSGNFTRLLTLSLPIFAALLLLPASHAQVMDFPTGSDAKAQPSDPAVKVPDFDVVSIKESHAADGRMEWGDTEDGFSTSNVVLKTIIAGAYGIKTDLISGGPSWINDTGFDITAKVTGEDVAALKKLTGRQRQAMLQPFLADRFHLKVHTATRTLPIYTLEVAKGGLKLKEVPAVKFDKADPKNTGSSMSFGPGFFNGERIGMPSLAENLSYIVHRTVLNKTALSGVYNVSLKYTPEDRVSESKADNGNGTDAAPSIFTAIEEQLGLRLVPTKGPVETLVIDQVEKPSAN